MADNYSVQIEADAKSPMPFSMIEGMMPAYPLIWFMGFMLVVGALILGLTVLTDAQLAFFADAKAVREAAGTGSSFAAANVLIHTIGAWVPSVKIFGLGLMLMAITMALGTIAKRLRVMGKVVAGHISAANRPATPELPARRRTFQMSAMMGIMILMAGAVISIIESLTTIPAYWNNSIADTLNPAQPGSVLLGQLQTQVAIKAWLTPFEFVGMAMLFLAITIALTVIIGALRTQAEMLSTYYNKAK